MTNEREAYPLSGKQRAKELLLADRADRIRRIAEENRERLLQAKKTHPDPLPPMKPNLAKP